MATFKFSIQIGSTTSKRDAADASYRTYERTVAFMTGGNVGSNPDQTIDEDPKNPVPRAVSSGLM